MPHEIFVDHHGQASFFCVREPAWHGLGTVLDRPATAAEAIRAAKLDWRVTKKRLVALDPHHMLQIPGQYAVVREDRWGHPDCPVFGIVGEEYTPLQNSAAFRFFDDVVGRKEAIYHTAGALGQGERVWILAKLPGEIRVVGDDVAEKYLLLSNSHDGSSSVQVKFTPIRVVCNNTLTMALRSGPTLRIQHNRRLRDRLSHARVDLGVIQRRFVDLEGGFRRMAAVQLDRDKLSEYLGLVFPEPPAGADGRSLRRVARERAEAERLFDQGIGSRLKGVTGTLWAAYNGVTEYVDHVRYPETSKDRRLESIWFGEGYQVKARAFKIADQQAARWLN